MALPAKFLIIAGRTVWTTLWQTMMAQLAPRDRGGAYVRPESEFRATIAADSPHPAAAQRYRLFVGMTCPWAHRTLLVRALKGLESAIAVSFVLPSPDDGGWRLAEVYSGCDRLAQLYQLARPNYQGRSTTPVLWDEQLQTIVNNESAEIIEILNSQLNELAANSELDLYPVAGRADIDRWNEAIYHKINNGVYRCGFAQTQAAYDEAVSNLFGMLDTIEAHLASHQFLWGERITLADVRLFPTLIRFDVVYYGLFKCCRNRVRDFPNLSRYVRSIYHMPGVAATCNFVAMRRDYYGSLFPLNPGGIVPIGMDMSWLDG
jgi:glutathionyl-hydroquinone reductase